MFNLGTPKQVRFFLPLANTLRCMGFEVSFVTRDFSETNLVIAALGVDAVRLGRYGGATPLGKLLASTERITLLGKHFDALRPDVVVTLGNHECVRAAFGLGIPVVLFCDLPENVPVACLTLPLATVVCAPTCIPPNVFYAAGVSSERLVFYDSLDPIAWLEGFRPNSSHLTRYGIDSNKRLLVCRETEWQSGYVRDDIVASATVEIARQHPGLQIISIPRYEQHPYFDTPNLLAFADLFVGGGGTMCIEAAYFGTPVIATRALECYYMDWLFTRRLAVPCATLAEVVAAANDILCAAPLEHRLRQPIDAFREMTFPLQMLADVIISAGNGSPSPRQQTTNKPPKKH